MTTTAYAFLAGFALAAIIAAAAVAHLARALRTARQVADWRAAIIRRQAATLDDTERAVRGIVNLCECYGERIDGGHDRDADRGDAVPLHLYPPQWDGEEDYGERDCGKASECE